MTSAASRPSPMSVSGCTREENQRSRPRMTVGLVEPVGCPLLSACFTTAMWLSARSAGKRSQIRFCTIFSAVTCTASQAKRLAKRNRPSLSRMRIGCEAPSTRLR